MKRSWFKPYAGFYLPVTIEGVIVTVVAMAFLAPIYAAIIRNGHSVSDDMYHMFVYTSCTVFWWKWVAEKNSK